MPRLPRLHDGVCPKCGGTETVSAKHIRYINIHGEGNTGLPDYFALIICRPGTERYAFLSQWGNPYSLYVESAPRTVRRVSPHNELRIVGRPRRSAGQQLLDFDL
ncbi:hypothetical protein [Nitrospira sp. Nam74]